MADGFLGRWSKRKLEVKEGKAVEAEVVEPAEPSPQPSPASGRGRELPEITPSPPRGEGGGEGAPTEQPPLTLADVQALTQDSDFTRFVAPDVAPEVKNAAMKKLFADPRYNVMDGLDTYTDDYSKPDPLPEHMLRKLVAGKFLRLFDQQEKEEARIEEAAASARQPRDVADNPTEQSVAQSKTAQPAVPEPPPHADPDLRLQQDDAAPGQDPGRGTP